MTTGSHRVEQAQVDHGRLVHHEQVHVEGVVLVLAEPAPARVPLEQPVDRQVRVAANGRGEMAIALAGQGVMPLLDGAVEGPLHGAEHGEVHGTVWDGQDEVRTGTTRQASEILGLDKFDKAGCVGGLQDRLHRVRRMHHGLCHGSTDRPTQHVLDER
mgnify:CR=1 FL=1